MCNLMLKIGGAYIGFPSLQILASTLAIITHVICFCSVMGVATMVGSRLLFWDGGVGFVSNLVSFLVRYTLVSMSCAIMGSAGFPISISFIPCIFPIFLSQVLMSSLCQCVELLDCSNSWSIKSMYSLSMLMWSISFLSTCPSSSVSRSSSSAPL